MAVVSPLSTFINIYRQHNYDQRYCSGKAFQVHRTFTVCSIESVAISAVTLITSNGVVTLCIHTPTVISISLTLIKVYNNQEDNDDAP